MTKKHSRRGKTLTRRNMLKTLGITSGTLAFPVGVGTAASQNETKDSARTLRPSTSEFDTLDEVRVDITEEGLVRVSMSGVVEPGTPAKGYTVDIQDLHSSRGRLTVNRAQAAVKQIPSRRIPDEPENEAHIESQMGQDSDSGYRPTTQDSDVGTMHHGGSDNEHDYDGGCWIRSEDPPDWRLCKTDHRMKWRVRNGQVTWYDRHRHWHTWRHSVPESNWNLDDIRWTGANWRGSDFDSNLAADYIERIFALDGNSTHAHHRSLVSGNVNGTMDWGTSHWHNGELSRLLRTDAGHYSHN